MSQAPLPFGLDEYRDRVARTRAAMAAEGIDALILVDPAAHHYLTGYSAWSFYVPQFVVVRQDDDMPWWIGRPMDARGAAQLTWLRADHVFEYPENLVQAPAGHAISRVCELLRARGQAALRLGVESDNYFFSARAMSVLRQGLPEARITDAAHILKNLRAVKSAAEISYIRQAAEITDRAMAVGLDGIREGRRSCDMAADVWKALIEGTPAFGGTYPGSMPKFPSGADFATSYHFTWSDERFATGFSTGLELSGARHHYHAPLARTVFLGEPPQIVRDAADAIRAGMEAAFPLLRPGIRAEEVEAAWRKEASARGFDKGARIGYSVGSAFTATWGDCPISLRAGDATPLQENMVFHFIPSFMIDRWGIEISETLIVTPSGGEALSRLARDIVVHG